MESDPISLDNPVPNARSPYRHAGKPHSQSDPFCSLATRVSTKLEEGYFRGAVSLACLGDSVAEHSDVTIAALMAKHPAHHPDMILPAPPLANDLHPPLAVTEQDVSQAVQSFSRGSARGPLPQHLKDLISISVGFGGKKLLTVLTSFTSLVLSGDTPTQMQPLFFGAFDSAEQEEWRGAPNCSWLHSSMLAGKSGKQGCPGMNGVVAGTSPNRI